MTVAPGGGAACSMMGLVSISTSSGIPSVLRKKTDTCSGASSPEIPVAIFSTRGIGSHNAASVSLGSS